MHIVYTEIMMMKSFLDIEYKGLLSLHYVRAISIKQLYTP